MKNSFASERSLAQEVESVLQDVQALEEEQLAAAVLRLNGWLLGIVFGIMGGLGLFVATNWLVLKGGEVVGPHLGLLGQFFPGYTVTFGGSFIGLAYGFALGFVSGALIAWVYNGIVLLRRPRT